MSVKRACVLLLVLAAPAAGADEWTPARAFRVFNKTNQRGLPQTSVMSLAQDADGVLWVGTLDGLASFDGRTVTPVPAVPAAPLRGLITAIVPRRAGGVYVGSPAGVHVFDGQAWTLAPSARQVVALAEAADGTVWMADVDGALWTLDPSAGAPTWQRRPGATLAVALASSAEGAVWAATTTGVERVHGPPLSSREPGASEPLPGRPAALLVARDGRVWVATAAGTLHWTSPDDPRWHHIDLGEWRGGGFRALSEDRRGRIWAAATGGRVAFGTAGTPWTVWDDTNGPFGPGVMSVLGDREGSVWFGVNATGFAQWVGEPWSHRRSVDAISASLQRWSAFGLSRGADGRSLLVALFISGAMRLRDGPPEHFDDPQGLREHVRAIVEPEPGTLWAGTRFGLFESRGGETFRQVLTLPSGFVMGMYRSPQGRWYAGSSSQGVFLHEAGRWQPVEEINNALDDPHVRGMTWMRTGELWVATLRGVSIFREGAEPVRLTSRNVPALPGSVNAVLEVGDDVWAGGTGGIAIRHDGQWRAVTASDGIPGHTIYSLALGRDGVVWAGGSAGVGRYERGRWEVWDSRRGLLEEECNLNGLVVADDGSVFVGTMGGLARFDPSVSTLRRPPLKVVWLDPTGPLGTGLGDTSDRSLHLRWTAPWLGPEPIEYRVRVPRLGEAWSKPTTDARLDIENLTPGTWEVEVAARVEGTEEWSAPLRLSREVAPRWHETALARGAAVGLLTLLVLGLVRLRLRALRRHAAALEATVHERTAELADKVALLEASEERAQAANRAKSVFLANMSHELRTPLTGVLGFSQLMARRPGRDAEDYRQLDIIQRSGEHLLSLINDVLSLARIEAGGTELHAAPFDARALGHDITEMLRARAEPRGLTLECRVEDGVPPAVTGDEGKIRQILINLVGNAIKFTERGGVTLRVRWAQGRGIFEVEDTGPGIAPHEMAAVFAPFVQTETGKRAREGTGLGLALSRELARLMGGDIVVESELGRGSRFRLELSLPAAPERRLTETTREKRRVRRLASGQPAWRVLVVDDVPESRDVLGKLLRSVGYDVREAGTGEEALETWRTWQPHLIWMDKRMPGMGGLEATRRIRAEAQGAPPVKIVVHSASALAHEQAEILQSGCDEFVAKPFRESTIFETMARHLGARYEYEGEKAHANGVRRVLLVDDSEIVREATRSMLTSLGLHVTDSSGGEDALRRLAEQEFHAVLLDVEMPGMDGLQTLAEIRGRPGLASLPVIAMTGHAGEGDRERFLSAGMNDYVAKPVEQGEVARVLQQWLPGGLPR